MYRTAITAAIDLLRARRDRKAEPIETMRESGEGRLGTHPGPDAEYDAADLAAAVGQAVETLTPSRRPVVRMFLSGYEREEIARLMGWSEAKTRNLLYRGLADLRTALAKRGIGPTVIR
jgi:RNA polymerase sigma-70 factor (ECF subfamily)